MFIEIEDLKKDPLHVHHVFPAGEIKFFHEDAVLSNPVTTDFIFEHQDRDLHIVGTVETAICFRCSRCTKDYKKAFSAGFDLSYQPRSKLPNEHVEVELKYEEMEVAYYDGIAFDVDLMVLEQIELAMPMKFVCRDDCKGLCYQCGTDLNEGDCLCNREINDARLSVLLDFKKKTDR